MNELQEKLAALGLSPEQVDATLQTVADFVKSKLPDGYEGLVDGLLAGKVQDIPPLGGLFGSFKGLFR